MSDRTQFVVGRNTLSMPKTAKRLVEAGMATAATCLATGGILILNTVLTGRGGWMGGIDIWLAFIRRPDIMGTMVLTALCTVMFLNWYRDGGNSLRR